MLPPVLELRQASAAETATVNATQQQADEGIGPSRSMSTSHSSTTCVARNGEIKRRTEAAGILPNDDAFVRLVGAFLLEQNDEWASSGPCAEISRTSVPFVSREHR